MIMDNPAASDQQQQQQQQQSQALSQQQQQSWMERAQFSNNMNSATPNFYRAPIEEESLSHLHRKQLEILRNEQQRGMNHHSMSSQQQQQPARSMMQDDLFAPLSFPGFAQQQQQQPGAFSKDAKLHSDAFAQRRGLEPHQRLSRTGLRGDPLNEPLSHHHRQHSLDTPFGSAAGTGHLQQQQQPKTKDPSVSRFMDNLREQSQWNEHSNEASASSVYDSLPYDPSFNIHSHHHPSSRGNFLESNARNTPPYQQQDPSSSLPPLSYGSTAGASGNTTVPGNNMMYNNNSGNNMMAPSNNSNMSSYHHSGGMAASATGMGPTNFASSTVGATFQQPTAAQQPQPGSAMAAAMLMDDEEEDSRFKPFHEEKWAVRYKELVHFHRENGHSAVPHTYPPNPQLARWVKRQRRQ